MDELGKSIPLAEGLVDAEGGTANKTNNENCLNCGTKLVDTFCHHCGQKDIPKRQTLGELLSNFISSFWSYEGKFFKTTKYLLTKPGFLAVEYNKGRRESYYHPARMYVFISFVFFLLVFSLPSTDDDSDELTKEDQEELTKAKENLPKGRAFRDSSLLKSNIIISDSAQKNSKSFTLSDTEFKTVEAYDSAEKLKPESERDGWFERQLEIKNIELSNKYKKEGDFSRDFTNAFKENFSKVLFYLLPLFALLLKLLYMRRDFFYSEHLVFSIYYYNFFYLGGSIFLLVSQIPFLSEFTFIIGFWIYFYLLFAMKRMYQQGWGKTITKFVLFSFLFSILISLGVSISALFILMAM